MLNPHPHAPIMESRSRPSHVLVVEDEPLIALDIEDALVENGFAVRLARSIAEARTLLAALPPPAMVLLDVVLPDGRSFELAADILTAGVPLVFLTGYDHGIPDELKDVTVVQKPFSSAGLVAVVIGLSGAVPID
jgi:DNA-binding response OmpR family regulator